jgi:hypothetical protein
LPESPELPKIAEIENQNRKTYRRFGKEPIAKSRKPTANYQLLFANCFSHGCPTTTIDSGPPPVGEVEIKAVVVFAAVMFAFNTDTVLDPLLAT